MIPLLIPHHAKKSENIFLYLSGRSEKYSIPDKLVFLSVVRFPASDSRLSGKKGPDRSPGGIPVKLRLEKAGLERVTFEQVKARGDRPAQSEPEKRGFSAKRQAVWLETQSVLN